MNKFVLVRTDGYFVAVSGYGHSYTKDITKARLFRTRDEAEVDRCVDSEVVRELMSFFVDYTGF